MIASAIRKSLREAGTRRPSNAMTPRENAISVAEGIAQPGGCARRIPRRSEIDQGWDDHAPDSRGGGEDRPPWVGELAGDYLAFDFEPDQ